MRYPLYMTFFSTPDKLEIDGMPFVTAADKPTRREALTYYRKVAEYFELDVRQYHEVQGVQRPRDGVELTARHPDRKSTRLNSSHSQISYAVFCLQKKTDTHLH